MANIRIHRYLLEAGDPPYGRRGPTERAVRDAFEVVLHQMGMEDCLDIQWDALSMIWALTSSPSPHLWWLLVDGGYLPYENLRSVDLRGYDLHGSVLAKMHLEEANLDGADLSHSYLAGAFLPKTLTRTCLRGACLRNTPLCGRIFMGVDFRGADLTGADLRGCTFIDCTFRGARM